MTYLFRLLQLHSLYAHVHCKYLSVLFSSASMSFLLRSELYSGIAVLPLTNVTVSCLHSNACSHSLMWAFLEYGRFLLQLKICSWVDQHPVCMMWTHVPYSELASCPRRTFALIFGLPGISSRHWLGELEDRWLLFCRM